MLDLQVSIQEKVVNILIWKWKLASESLIVKAGDSLTSEFFSSSKP